MEVEKQAKPQAAHTKVGQNLRSVCWYNFGYCFDLYDQLLIHKNISAKAFVEPDSFIEYRNSRLALEGDSCLPKLVTQTAFIDGFEHPWTRRPMYLDRERDHALGQILCQQHLACLRAPPWCFVASVLNS
jgi:hypothetical protein